MEERKPIAADFIKEGHPVSRVLKVVGIPRSSYYYKPREGRRGRHVSEYTRLEPGGYVTNEQVVSEIRDLLEHEFVDYGYLKVTHWLRQEKNYIINPKKVYRLMSAEGLLNKSAVAKRRTRNWVKILVPEADHPFDYLEFDLKYAYVAGSRKNAIILTVIDVRTRWVLGQYLAWSVRESHVRKLFDQLFEAYPLPLSFYVRNDNGSQFVAECVQRYFEEKGVTQEFCKPATPEQNAHIESYHSIVEAVVCQRYEFENLDDIRKTMDRFVKFYNFERIHSGVGYTSPYRYLLENGYEMKQYDIGHALDPASLKTVKKARGNTPRS